jgi:hypothetical protein
MGGKMTTLKEVGEQLSPKLLDGMKATMDEAMKHVPRQLLYGYALQGIATDAELQEMVDNLVNEVISRSAKLRLAELEALDKLR